MLSLNRKRARRALDQKIMPLRGLANLAVPARGWVRAIREALGMSGQQYADRLGIAWQSMADLEASEAAGTISLNSLRRAAALLNCQLAYALVPNAATLEETVEQRARAVAMRDLAIVAQTMTLENQAAPDADLEARISDYIVEHVRDRDLWVS